MSVMRIAEMVDLVWSGALRGVHHPEELRGRLSLREAYEVQLGLLERHRRAGQPQAGWKVGLTAKAMQEQQRLHEPVFGFLLAAGQRPSGTVFRFDELIAPGFENELCITLGATLRGPGVTIERAREAMATVAPALEIVERRGDFTADLPLALADNAQQKAFVTGAAASPGDLDLATVTVEVRVNGQSREQARGAEVLGTPVASLAWLANKLAEFGLALETGMRVMSGSFTRQYTVARGDRVEARFAPLGSVTAEFR